MKYFTISELARSSTARALGIDNTPNTIETAHLVELVDMLLDPLRAAWGGPLKVTSGFRCKELNDAIGGSKTSAHLFGWAADLVPADGRSVEELVNFTVEWLTATDLPFDQMIDERSGSSHWLHIGIKNQKGLQRKQMMVYRNGKYKKI